MARVTVDREWLARGADAVDVAVERAAALVGLTATRGASGLELRGGSQLKLRLSGSLLARDDYLPRRGLFYRTAVPGDAGLERLTLHLEEALGFDLMGPMMRRKYERVLGEAAGAIEAAITRSAASVQATSPGTPAAVGGDGPAADGTSATTQPADADASAASRSTADELEHLADLHERGVLTDSEFDAAKAKLLS